jgi:hypothetical protein
MLDENPHPQGVKISDEQMKQLEDRVLDRHAFHGEWNYALRPVPRPAPDPGPEPARPAPAGRCDPATLNHPALTGLDPADLTALAAALQVPFAAAREQRLYRKRGGPRRGTGNTTGHHPRLDLLGHLLATRMRQHLDLPPRLIGALLGADGTTISHATTLTAPLLAACPPPPAAPPPGIRLRTLDDLRDYAAGHGIAIPAAPGGHTPPAASTLHPPGTPKTQLNLEYLPGDSDAPSM